MAKRKEAATVDLKVRMKEPLRAALERSAKRRGVSMNAEAVDRLERSFTQEDEFGGPELLPIARLMASAFVLGGQRGRRARKHPEWTPAEWINDPTCYEVAIKAVVNALLAHQPVRRKLKPGIDPETALKTQKLRDDLHAIIALQGDDDEG